MKVAFVYPGSESLAIEYLSSMLKINGHETFLAFDPVLFNDQQYLNIRFLAKIFSYKKKLLKNIKKINPDLIAFSVVTDHYAWACDIAKEIKKITNAPILFGGIHATSVPEKVIQNDFVDIICIGEGEEAILELANKLENNKAITKIKNLWVKRDNKIYKNPVRPLIRNLDKLPLPDKSLFEKNIIIKKGRYSTMTSRGCLHNCTYCYNNVLKNEIYKKEGSNFLRRRHIKSVIKELKIMKEKYNIKNVDFMDDSFTSNKKWLKEFLDIYRKEINLPFQCMAHTIFVDEEVARLLKINKCTRIKFGVQNISEKIRYNILHRKFETLGSIKRALNACDKNHLEYSLDHIFGVPYVTEKEEKMTAKFYNKTKVVRICCYALAYFPKTEIIKYAKEEGKLNNHDIEKIECGKEKMYIYGSSLKGDELKRFYAFRNLYAIMPLMPKNLTNFLIDSNLYRILRFMPRFVNIFFELIMVFKTKHLRAMDYITYYSIHLKRSLAFN